jgi:hypothetical protein
LQIFLSELLTIYLCDEYAFLKRLKRSISNQQAFVIHLLVLNVSHYSFLPTFSKMMSENDTNEENAFKVNDLVDLLEIFLLDFICVAVDFFKDEKLRVQIHRIYH